jgi:uncharacterized protein YndB with AHSA1/START domain
MDQLTPLHFVFYFATTPDKVWEGFVSKEANRTIFMGAEFAVELRPGGAMTYSGPGPDGKPMTYVRCQILEVEPVKRLQYTFAMGERVSCVGDSRVPNPINAAVPNCQI